MKKMGMLSAATVALLFGVTAAAAQTNSSTINNDEELEQNVQTDPQQTHKKKTRVQGQQSQERGNGNKKASQTTGQAQQDTQTPQKRTPGEPAAQAVPTQPGAQAPAAASTPRGAQAPQQPAPSTAQPATTQQGATPAASAQPSAVAPTTAAPAQPTVAAPTTAASSTSNQVAVNDQQRVQITTVIRSQKIEPITNVNFAVTVGTRIPSSVRLTVLSDDIVQIVPQFRGHFFFVAQDQLVIIEPRTTQIVALIPMSSSTTTAAVPSQTTPQRPAPQARVIAPQNPAPQTTAMAPANTAQVGGEWRGSKLIGLNVYNNNNEKIGSIKELMLDQNGNIQTVVIGVGGFVGIRQHDVAVSFAEIRWVSEPVAPTRVSTGSRPDTSRSGSTRNYPDHAILNATKEQLKATAAFTYKQ